MQRLPLWRLILLFALLLPSALWAETQSPTEKVGPAKQDVPARVASSQPSPNGYGNVLVDMTTHFSIYSAQEDQGQTATYLPAVRKGYAGWNSHLAIQNLTAEEMAVTVDFYAGTASVIHSVTQNVPAYSSWNLDLSAEPGLPAPYNGSAVVHAAGPISAIDTQISAWASASYGAAYSGSTILYAPALYKDYYGWNSYLAVQNIGGTTTTVTVTYSDGLVRSVPVAANAAYLFDQAEEPHPDSAFSAVITADQPLAAIVHEYNSSVGADTYEAPLYAAHELAAPRTVKYHNGWVSTVNVRNVGTSSANVMISYEGYESHAYTVQVSPGASHAFVTPAESFLPSGYAGAAHLTSDQPIVAWVTLGPLDSPLDGSCSYIPAIVETQQGVVKPRANCSPGHGAAATIPLGRPPTGNSCVPVHGVDFTWEPVTPYVWEEVTFIGQASGTWPISFFWDFGDGNIGEGSIVTHWYEWEGDFMVTMTATNCATATASITHVLSVVAPPPPPIYEIFFPATPRDGEQAGGSWTTSLIVQNLSVYDGVIFVEFFDPLGGPHAPAMLGPDLYNPFMLGAGRTQEISLSQVPELPSGHYAAIVSSDVPIFGIAVLAGEYPCTPPVGADFTWSPLTPLVSETVYFTATAQGTGPFTYAWAFGDGEVGSGQTASHTYSEAGTYTVFLTVTNDCGLVTATHDIVVVEGCVEPSGADFTWSPANPVVGEEVHFTGIVEAGSPPFTYEWYFGDGTWASGNPISHVFQAEGTYTNTLTVTNICGAASVSRALIITRMLRPWVYLPVVLRGHLAYFAGPWEQEPNDTYNQANGPLRSGQDYYGYPADTDDFFYFLSGEGTITVDLVNYLPGPGGGQLLLYRGANYELVGRAYNPPYHISYTGPADRYYVRIYTVGLNPTQPYTLRVSYPLP